jgi:hypothetical protein
MTQTPLQQLRPVLREAIGVHAIIERMGFSMSDIYMVCSRNPASDTWHVMVLLKAQGQQFVYDCGPIDIADVAVDDEWPKIAGAAFAAWNGAGQPERDLLFEHCHARKDAVPMVAAIMAKGIMPPAGES